MGADHPEQRGSMDLVADFGHWQFHGHLLEVREDRRET